ncbi:MAG: ABC transporter ATP-binding protein [Oscillospiraceae bacterium]|nr:ABC transporter ATP-binding protein [Oscillospiraceae bacterium]
MSCDVTKAIIEIKNIKKVYGKGDNKVTALNGIDMTVHEGEFVAILGPSGSGKSTLMNIIGLMDNFDSGEYYLDGIDIAKEKEHTYAKIRNSKIGFIFQKYNLIPQYTALYNVALPIMLQGESYKTAKIKSYDMLSRVGLEKRIKHKPSELSGGQLQRVAIARALISNSPLILADEPTGALDQKTGHEVLDILKELNKEHKTIIMITHDPKIAARAGRVVRVEDGMII